MFYEPRPEKKIEIAAKKSSESLAPYIYVCTRTWNVFILCNFDSYTKKKQFLVKRGNWY